jgi:hypothetical protein
MQVAPHALLDQRTLLMHQQAFPAVNCAGLPTCFAFAACLIMNEFSARVKDALIMNASRVASGGPEDVAFPHPVPGDFLEVSPIVNVALFPGGISTADGNVDDIVDFQDERFRPAGIAAIGILPPGCAVSWVYDRILSAWPCVPTTEGAKQTARNREAIARISPASACFLRRNPESL